MAAAATPASKRSTSPSAAKRSPSSLAQLKKRAQHLVTAPSGGEYLIRVPNLGLLLEGDALPNNLRTAALREIVDPLSTQAARGDLTVDTAVEGKTTVTMETVQELYELHQWLVVQTVLEPVLTLADLPELPQEDLEMLTQIATRERTTDAAGRSLGTEPLSRWNTFREEHGCPEGCPACQAVIEMFSTTTEG